LRQRGYVIVNRDEWHSGTRVSWFRLEEPVAARYASGKFGAAAYRK
jgi:hypothetical protein